LDTLTQNPEKKAQGLGVTVLQTRNNEHQI